MKAVDSQLSTQITAPATESRPTSTFDHGQLNVPLMKRGDIHRDIDKLKSEKAAESKARSRKLREAQRAVKQIHRVLVDMTWGDPDAALLLARRIGDLISASEEPAIEVPGVPATYSSLLGRDKQ